jgi:superfamily I DNA/RNA helicase
MIIVKTVTMPTAEPPDAQAELEQAIHRVVASASRKKLVVAGPGAGKTHLFGKLIAAAEGEPKDRLVLTFINALKSDLHRNLGELSSVYTLHGYCQFLLRQSENLRRGLSKRFRCYPGLSHIIPLDWEWLCLSDAPHFIDLMRNLNCSAQQAQFYIARSNYYDAVDFDDSVYRTYAQLAADISNVPEYSLVLIDEFQDFNKMEASIIDLLADRNSIVIAGDDDQALYSQLRSASWDHIRNRYEGGHYEIFELPFCLRCPEVIVNAVNDVLARAQAELRLNGRIPKPYRYYRPLKGEDSTKFPHIELVETSVQRLNANYFGRYVEQCVRAIPPDEFAIAAEKNEPVALIIASNPYGRQVEAHLLEAGLLTAKHAAELTDLQKALQILSEDPKSNLGWRIVLGCGDETVARSLVCKAHEGDLALVDVIPVSQRDKILSEATEWAQKTRQSILPTNQKRKRQV